MKTKEDKQLKELSDEELRQVTGGKESNPSESQGPCNNEEYRKNNQNECSMVLTVEFGDSK